MVAAQVPAAAEQGAQPARAAEAAAQGEVRQAAQGMAVVVAARLVAAPERLEARVARQARPVVELAVLVAAAA